MGVGVGDVSRSVGLHPTRGHPSAHRPASVPPACAYTASRGVPNAQALDCLSAESPLEETRRSSSTSAPRGHATCRRPPLRPPPETRECENARRRSGHSREKPPLRARQSALSTKHQSLSIVQTPADTAAIRDEKRRLALSAVLCPA